MKYLFIFLCSMLLLTPVVFADDVIGFVNFAVGKIAIIRAGEKIRPKRGMEIKFQDKITSGKNTRFTITLLDGNQIEIPAGEELFIEEIIVKALSRRSNSALAAFQAFLKKLAKDKDYDSVMIATMGARGILDEVAAKKSIREIDKLLLVETDPATVLDLLLMKADLYLELGNYIQARKTYEELKARDKNKTKEEEINGLLAIINALGNKHVHITLFDCKETNISRVVFEIVRTDLLRSGMLNVPEKKGEIKPGSGIHYILTGAISYNNDDVRISAQLATLQGKKIDTWSVSGHENTIEFCSQQLAGLIHYSITGKDIPAQNITRYVDEPEGIDPLDEVDLYLGLNKDGILPAYKIDEELIIHFKLNGNKSKMYYISIMSIGPDSEVNQLFPNSFNKKNQVKTNVHYTLPAENDPYEFAVYGNPGKNYIIGILTEQPLTLADNEKIEKEVFPMLSTNPENFIKKGLSVCAVKSKVKKWRIGVIHFMAVKE